MTYIYGVYDNPHIYGVYDIPLRLTLLQNNEYRRYLVTHPCEQYCLKLLLLRYYRKRAVLRSSMSG